MRRSAALLLLFLVSAPTATADSQAAAGFVADNVAVSPVLKRLATEPASSLKELASSIVDLDASLGAGKNIGDGVTPLMAAAGNPDDGVVQLLLDQGARVDAKTTFGVTSLMIAAMNPAPGPLDRLLAAGARVNALDRDGQNALMAACVSGNLETARRLIARTSDMSIRDVNMDTVMTLAVKSGSTKLVGMLLEKGGNVKEEATVRQKDGSEFAVTLLELAALTSTDPAMLDFLLSKGAAIKDRVKDNGPSALTIAAAYNTNPACVQLLLKNGAHIQGVEYRNPVNAAARFNSNPLVARALLDAGLLPAPVHARGYINGDVVQAADVVSPQFRASSVYPAFEKAYNAILKTVPTIPQLLALIDESHRYAEAFIAQVKTVKGMLCISYSGSTSRVRGGTTVTYKERPLMGDAEAGSGYDVLRIPSIIVVSGYGSWDLTELSQFEWSNGFSDYPVKGSDQSGVLIAGDGGFLNIYWGEATGENMDLMEKWKKTLEHTVALADAFESLYILPYK